jgi:sugar/nucleoside kinase (ribokinase family)
MLAAIGDLLLDISIRTEDRLRAGDDTPACIRLGGGGQAGNWCAWVAELGGQARLITRVGRDPTGHRLVDELRSAGVDVRAVEGTDPTGVIAVVIGADAEPAMATQRGAIVGLSPAELDPRWLDGVELLHVPGYSLFLDPLAATTRQAIARVRAQHGVLSVDLSSEVGIADYGPARFVELLGCLRPELLFATRAEAGCLGVPLVDVAAVPVIKLGEQGCRLSDGTVVAAAPVDPVDTNGAGDAFAAAFCLAYLHGSDGPSAARQAVTVAARAVAQVGARPCA